jgi:hypothetical protein
MSELIELDNDILDDGKFNMGSVNHSWAHFKSVVKLKPNISVYWQTPVPEATLCT